MESMYKKKNKDPMELKYKKWDQLTYKVIRWT